MDVLQNFLGSHLLDFISEINAEIIKSLTDVIVKIFTLGSEVALGNKLSFVNTSFLFVQGISSLLLCCMLAKQVISTYITETDGDPDTEPTQLLVKFSMAIAVIWASGSAFKILLDWSEKFSNELLGNADFNVKGIMENVLATFSTEVLFTLILSVYIIGVIVFAFKAGVRGAELTLMKILLPIFACDLLTSNREKWNAFSFSGLIVIFGYVVQLFLFRISLLLLTYGAEPMYMALSGSFLYMAIKSPNWIEKFSYNSRLGESARSAPYLLATFLKK